MAENNNNSLFDKLSYAFPVKGNLYRRLTDQQKDEIKRFTGKIGTSTVRGAVELGRMLTEPGSFPSRREMETGQFRSREETEKLREDRLKRIEAVESNFFEPIYRKLVGADNVERSERGDYSVAVIKDPEDPVLDIASDVGEIAANISLAGKVTKGIQTKTKFQKFLKDLGTGEAGFQVAFNPYDDEKFFPQLIGNLITEDDGILGDLKTYLEADPQTKSQLENRIDLLADSILFAGGFAVAGAGIRAGKEQFDKLEFRKQFKTYLENIGSKGKETVDNFLNRIKTFRDMDATQKRAALYHRQKNIEEGKVVGIGDMKALEPYKGTKWLTNTNLQFSESPILRMLDNFRTKLFSTRGGKPRQLHEKFLRTENLKEKWSDEINNTAFNLELAIDDIVEKVGKNKEDLLDDVSRVLFWDRRSPTLVTSRGTSIGQTQGAGFEKALKKLPEELQEPVRKFRDLQDNLSVKMLETDYLTETQRKIYTDNLGFYVRRSYKLFEDPNYVPTPKALKEAEDYLSQQLLLRNPNLTPDEVKLRVAADIQLILKENMSSANFGSSLERFDKIRKSILNGRKDIPPEIRNLMGEMDNPIQQLIHSTTKLSRLYEDAKFYDIAYNDGLGIYFRENAEGAFRQELPAGYGKLSGTYTTPELAQYFSNYKKFSQELLESEKFGIGSLYKNTLLLKGLSQAAKTVWSHTTHIKNMTGGVQMSLANGINVFSASATRYIRQVLNAKTSNDLELQKFHEELSGRGLLNKGVIARDLQGLANDVAKIKKGAVVGKIDWLLEKMPIPYYSFKKGKFQVTSPKGIAGEAQNKYIAQDDFFKINMYIREQQYLNKFNDALPNDSKFDFYRFNQETLKDEAALITRDVLPNYDLVPEMLKDLRRTPFFGRFFSFMAESMRISVNSIKRGINEVKFGNNLVKEGADEAGNIVKNRGLLRLGAFTTVAGGTAKAVQETSKFLAGIGGDALDAIKDFLPDYMRNSNVTVSVAPDGTPMIGNFSSWDAYDFPKKPLQVLINRNLTDPDVDEEGLVKDVLTTLTTEMISPFLGESIIQEQISNYILRGGRNLDGNLMRNPFDKTMRFDDSQDYINNITNKDNLTIFMANLLESITPGTITRTTDWIDTIGKEQTPFDQDIYPAESFIKFLTGYGMQPMNKEYLENIYTFKANDLLKVKSKRRRRLFDGIEEPLNIDTFTDKYLKENFLYYRDYAKFHKLSKSADVLNLNTIKLLKDAGMSKLDRVDFITTNKTYSPLGISESLKSELLEKAKDTSDYIDVLMDIRAIDAQLSNLPVIFDPENYKGQQELIDEIKEELRKDLAEGGEVQKEFPVPFVKIDPKERESDDLGGISYAEQMNRLGFKSGGKVLPTLTFSDGERTLTEKEYNNMLAINEYLKGKGYRKEARAGILGNINIETGGSFSPKQIENAKDKTLGYGIFQLTGKKKDYDRWMKENNFSVENTAELPMQIEYMHETIYGNKLTGKNIGREIGPGTAARLQKSFATGTAEEIALAFSNDWEKPEVPHNEARQKSSSTLFNLIP